MSATAEPTTPSAAAARPITPALLVGATVAGLLFALWIARTIVGLPAYGFASDFIELFVWAIVDYAAFGAGVFAVLAFLVPLSSSLSLVGVLVRALAAAGGGAVGLIVTYFIWTVVYRVADDPVELLLEPPIDAIQSALTFLPAVAAVVLVFWVNSRKPAPAA